MNNVYDEFRLRATGPTRLDDYIDSKPIDEWAAYNKIPEADSRPIDEMATDYNKWGGEYY